MATLTVKSITGYSGNAIGWDGKTVQAVIVADDTPSSLTIDATDVNGLGDYTKLAAGSVIITPDDDYIAFTGPAANGKTTFQKKTTSGGGGGGGSSDFSTATVTVNWQPANSITVSFMGAFFLDDGGYAATGGELILSRDFHPESISIILYKGAAEIHCVSEDAITITVSGNATLDNEYVAITGDCTITIS